MDVPNPFARREFRTVELTGVVPAVGKCQCYDDDLPVTMTWRRAEPVLVEMNFHAATGDVEWSVGRELLRAGLDAAAGIGDVMVYPDADDDATVTMTLESPSGTLTVLFDAPMMRAFIDDTMRVDDSVDPRIPDALLTIHVAEWAADMAGGDR